MDNKYGTLTGLFTAIANSIRGKTGGTGAIVADDFPSTIDSIEMGVKLPTLSNPAGARNIERGYQAIDTEGNLVEGSAIIPGYTVEIINRVTTSSEGNYGFSMVLTNPRKNTCKIYGGSVYRMSAVFCAGDTQYNFRIGYEDSDWAEGNFVSRTDTGLDFVDHCWWTGSTKDESIHLVIIDE